MENDVGAWAVILAGGRGARLAPFTADVPKQFLLWRGKPLFWHSAEAFARCSLIRGLVFVFPENFMEEGERLIRELVCQHELGLPWEVVPGGATRAESSRNGVLALPLSVKRVLIHDAARPFLEPSLVWRILENLDENVGGVVPTLPVKDTVKRVAGNGLVAESLPRAQLAATQTPQGFWTQILRQSWPREFPADVTDDAILLEKAGFKVRAVPGQETNVKITTEGDLRLIVSDAPRMPCSGFGYDAHRYGNERPLKIGGVRIPGKYGVQAHSDGDVLLHALIDAMLGCAGLGDIGQHFPDNDPAYDGISSAILLDQTAGLVKGAGVEIVQADFTVVAQVPKLEPFAREIRKNVANLLGLPVHRVNFKATSEEKMGFTGRQEGIKAYALVNGLRSWPE